MAKSCPNCLRKVEDEGRAFCPYCGEPMQEDLKRIMDARKIAEGQPVKETKAPEPPKTKKPIEPQKGDDGFTAHHVKKSAGCLSGVILGLVSAAGIAAGIVALFL